MGKTKKGNSVDAEKIRSRLIRVLGDYNRLQANMAEMENMFLTHVLMPSYQLRDTVRRREFLEEEYKRIRERIKDSKGLETKRLGLRKK